MLGRAATRNKSDADFRLTENRAFTGRKDHIAAQYKLAARAASAALNDRNCHQPRMANSRYKGRVRGLSARFDQSLT